MLLLVGLGNPGPGHAGNRHNVGFMAADEIVRRHGFSPFRRRFQGDLAEGRIAGEKVLLLKPMTYMNESGRAVRSAVDFYKIEPREVIVVYDEIDLVPGKLRVKQGGGHGGHNGLRDITRHIGAEFWRVRIGVGHPGDKGAVAGYVLHDFAKAERPGVEKMIDAIAEALPKLIEGHAAGFMNLVARAVNPPRPKPPRPSPAQSKSPGKPESESDRPAAGPADNADNADGTSAAATKNGASEGPAKDS